MSRLTFRHLRRNGRYLIINILGLGFALGFSILSYINYRFAHSYDAWHRDADRIVRVETIKESSGEAYGVCPSLIAPVAAAELAGVEAALRIDSRGTVVKRGDNVFNEPLHFADENFAQFFDFEVVAGSADLRDPSHVLITQEVADKYFGSENPLGQTLIFYADLAQRKPLTVSGVLKTPPLNSSVRFRFLTHFDNLLDEDKPAPYKTWTWLVDAVFLKLKQPGDQARVAAGLAAYVAPRNSAVPDNKLKGYRLEPLRALALHSRDLDWNNLWQGLPPSSVWGTAIMSILLVLTAALNFANMTIAVCNRRLREMGVRKVMGGTRFQLMRQLLGESLVVVTLAASLGMLLAYPLVDWYNSTWKFTDLRVDYTVPQLLIGLVIAVAFTTLLAGSYPAFYISAFRPASIFRGGVLFGGSNLFSRLMMGLQVTISLIAVVVGVSFARNAEFNRTADIGFNYAPILQAWLPTASDYARFNDAVHDLPGVVATAGTRHLPGFAYNKIEFKWRDAVEEANLYQVGNDLPAIMGMRLAQGAWPAPAGDTTASAEVVVNQTFARQFNGGNTSQLIGQEIRVKDRPLRIAGIVTDFMTRNPFIPIRPTLLQPIPSRDYQRCVIKTASTDQQPQVMAAIEQKWKQLFPYTPFNVGYQNEMLQEATEVSTNIARSMALFALVAILLTVTGLFSLVSLNALRRMREVAVRRVLGASAGQVSWVLNKNYGWIFVLAVVLGCLGGRFLALLLMNSIFKINIGVPSEALIISTLGILLVAVATIGIKTWQTLRVNPADVLRGD